jgi:hypothetical protein
MLKRLFRRFSRKGELTPKELADLEDELPDLVENQRYREGRRDTFVDIRIGPPSGRASFPDDPHNP